LSSGASSRLYQKLVKDKELAMSVSADATERRGPATFWLGVMARPNADLAEIERLLAEEIARLQAAPIRAAELIKVRNQLTRQRAQQLFSTRARANALGHFAVYYNDPSLINQVWRNYLRVTPADLQGVAQKYFRDSNRTVVTTLPKAGAR
jgi:predicted Zn-dependent peptidase